MYHKPGEADDEYLWGCGFGGHAALLLRKLLVRTVTDPDTGKVREFFYFHMGMEPVYVTLFQVDHPEAAPGNVNLHLLNSAVQ